MTHPSMLSERASRLEPSIIRGMGRLKKPTSLDLTLGQPALPPDEDLVDRAFEKWKAGDRGYTENAGLADLRKRVAAHYGFHDWTAAENAIVTVGSEEALFLALTCALNPGDGVLLPDPSYPAYLGIAKLVGAEPIAYPIDRATGLVAHADVLRERLTPTTRAIVLGSPSNPFGMIDSADEIRAIAELCEERGIVAVSDEIYRDLTYDGATVASICEHLPSSIFVSGLSKSCALTGFRLGYLVGPTNFIAKATLAHQLMVTCAPRISQLVALEIFEEPSRLRAHVSYYERAREGLRIAARELPSDAELRLGSGAFYATLDVSAYADGDPMALALELLEREDVVVVPGTAFGASGDWFWRLSYSVGKDTAEEGLRRIARFLRERARVIGT